MENITTSPLNRVCSLRSLLLGVLALTLCNVNANQSELENEIANLRRENLSLKQSLIASNKKEEQFAHTLSQVRKKMGAMGNSLLTGNDNSRLLSALSEIEFLQKRVDALETATIDLTESYRKFSKNTLASDSEARNEVETSIRSAEVALGFRFKPQRQISAGTLQNAKIISIDQESGLVVLNIGRSKDARIGMQFSINRGNLNIATGIIAEVRQNIAGLLIQETTNQDLIVNIGDSAKVLLN